MTLMQLITWWHHYCWSPWQPFGHLYEDMAVWLAKTEFIINIIHPVSQEFNQEKIIDLVYMSIMTPFKNQQTIPTNFRFETIITDIFGG